MVGRVKTDGKHFAHGDRPFRVRGVTYGTFARRSDGELFPEPLQIEADLAQMASVGVNVVRTYTAPPPDLLETADAMGLRVLAGVHYSDWRLEPHAGPRAWRRVLDAGRSAIATAMERCAGRGCVLGVLVGNEVPGDVARLHGIAAVERVLSRLVEQVHDSDPEMPASYASFPTTEYLRIAGQDFAAFNVFLERPDQLRSYLRHLQALTGEMPLVVTELGLAAGIHGDEAQAASLAWQLRAVDECGCAGATVFSWTDDWVVTGADEAGWGFGVTRADRSAKPAFDAVREWAGRAVRDLRETWPSISVVVCAHNGDRLLADCLASLHASDYPDLEVIVCDDGSTDGTAAVAKTFPFRLLELPRVGLGAARNSGIAVARGEIVAFIDADAACHPEWPYHLALSLEDPAVAATGGPNLPMPDAGLVERAVSLSPGNPAHVLVAGDRAEHVPGCNSAFRRTVLNDVGGFDPTFTAAGDDVDLCWRLLDRGLAIGFSPAAQVRHRRRATVRGYIRQQRGYGRAERLLRHRHPQRFNGLAQARWTGFIYGGLSVLPWLLRPVVYYGPMGLAPFQGVARRRSEQLAAACSAWLPLLAPLLLLGALAPVTAWGPAVAGLVLLLVLAYALAVAAAVPTQGEGRPFALRSLVAFLHAVQPVVRAWPRLVGRGPAPASERSPPSWQGDREEWLGALEHALRRRCRVRRARPHDRWDLDASVGPLLRCRVSTAVVWGWTPLSKVSLRPRLALWAAGCGGALAAVAEPWAGSLALAGLASVALVEAAVLRARVRSALESTTRGAVPITTPPARPRIGEREAEPA